MHGSLKDYLKKLVSGKTSSLHPLQAPPCCCPCHYPLPTSAASDSDRTEINVNQYLNKQTDAVWTQPPHVNESQPHPVLAAPQSPEDSNSDPIAAAHAAHLLCLLDSNLSKYDSFITRREDQGDVEDKTQTNSEDSTGSNSSECYTGRCAYHSMDDCPQYYNNTRREMSNAYYNYRRNGQKGRSDHELANPPPLLSLPYINTSTKVNEGEEHVVGDCACQYHTYQNSGRSCHGDVASTSAHCSPCSGKAQTAVAAHCQNCGCHEVKGNSKGRLSYFEILDYANQISKGMEHLESMKVSWLVSSYTLCACISMQCVWHTNQLCAYSWRVYNTIYS